MLARRLVATGFSLGSRQGSVVDLDDLMRARIHEDSPVVDHHVAILDVGNFMQFDRIGQGSSDIEFDAAASHARRDGPFASSMASANFLDSPYFLANDAGS